MIDATSEIVSAVFSARFLYAYGCEVTSSRKRFLLPRIQESFQNDSKIEATIGNELGKRFSLEETNFPASEQAPVDV